MEKINISGSIGYTLLSKEKIKVLVLSDIHSTLPYCDRNGIFISDWLKKKYSSKILLEEVPRKGTTLKELWPSSLHTQKLKETYLNNSKVIQGIDIRPFLIPYSWELSFDKQSPNLTLKQYLTFLNLFCNLKLDYLRSDLKQIYTKEYLQGSSLGMHYLDIKNRIKLFVKINKPLLNKKIKEIVNDEKYILENLNDLTSSIMEWYIIAKIFQGLTENKNTFIIHAGLSHTSNVIEVLKSKYGYIEIFNEGITDFNKIDENHNGCLQLPMDVERQFGGFNLIN